MPIPSDLEKLTEMFRRLGASEPESWASSQINEGIEQMHRFLFLRQAWSRILNEKDTSWIELEIENAGNDETAPYAGIGLALKRCLDCGVDPQDLTDIVRGKQAEFLFGLCYLLEDPDFKEKELEDVGWGLVRTNEQYQPTLKPITALHESVLEMDPTGREMRPRKA